MITRRTFIHRISTSAGLLAVVGVAACSDGDPAATSPAPTSGTEAPTTTSTPSTTTSAPTTSTTSTSSTTPAPIAAGWRRVDLGFVSAYVVARRGEAVIIDTGTPGAESSIERGLEALGVGWGDVADVIVTHRHNDHAGSLRGVMDVAAGATAHAGVEDLDAIGEVDRLQPVADGAVVAGLTIVATPGHTPGHISVLDPELSVFFVGDALVNTDGLGGPVARFTSDMETAIESARRIGALEYDTILFGHGDPIEGGASQLVAALADTL